MADLYCCFNSRWEAKYPLLEIFLKHQVVFAGLDSVDKVNSEKERFKAGTKIAVCDGLTIKAVGFALEDFNSLDNLKIDFSEEERKEGGNFDVNNQVLAVKAKLFELDENESFPLPHTRPGFSIVHIEDFQNKIDKYIKKHSH